MQRLNYSRAPITEAVIDLRVAPVEGFDVEQFALLQEQIKSDYPRFSFIETEQVEFRFEQGFKAQHDKSKSGILLSSADDTRSVQARLDGFTFSQRAPYSAWEPFRDEARRLWSAYRLLYAPASIARVAHRAINQINMPFEPGFQPETYLLTRPNTSPDLPGEVRGLFMQLQLWQPDLGCHLLLNQALVPPPDAQTFSVVLDFDLFREQFENPWGADQESDVWDLLEQLHVRRNILFEASITPAMKELLR